MPPDTYPLQNPRAAWRVYDGEAVIAAPDDSTLHTLNVAGTLIWESADGVTALADVVRRVSRAFDVPLDVSERDVAAFVETLRDRGLLTVESLPREASATPPGMTSDDRRDVAPRPYEPPLIVSEQMFETTALACGKIGGQGAICNVRPKSS